MNGSLFDLSGKTAIVTGAASGIGQRLAQTLAGAGAAVAFADINLAGAEAAAHECGASGANVLAVALDVTQPESVERAVDQVLAVFHHLDIGVNAAGVASGLPGEDTPLSIWNRVINTNLNGLYYCCLAYSAPMKAQHYGKIINIASMSASIVNTFPQPPVDASRILGLAAYCTSKAGVRQLTRVLAAQWAEDSIWVNSISPGYILTGMTRGIFEMPEVIESIHQQTPLHRVGAPADLDGLLLYLASDSSSFMTGSDLVIDGGFTLW